MLASAGRTKDAIAAGQKAFDLERRAAGADNPDTLWFENNLATYYLKDGNPAEAVRVWTDVVQRGRSQFTHGEWDLAHFLFHLGEAQATAGDKKAAQASLTNCRTLHGCAGCEQCTHAKGESGTGTGNGPALNSHALSG